MREVEVETWPAILDDAHQPKDEDLNLDRLRAVWEGNDTHPYAISAITGTLALTLKTMSKADTMDAAQILANEMWDSRDRSFMSSK